MDKIKQYKKHNSNTSPTKTQQRTSVLSSKWRGYNQPHKMIKNERR
jgi:hypothetical protein